MFLKRGSIGLSALIAGAGSAGALLGPFPRGKRIYGIPDSVRARTPFEDNLLRLSLARTDVPPEAWEDVAALSQLAQDVFDNPAVAQAFSRHPASYLRAIGLPHVALDTRSTEVKVALALGDADVRAAILAEDPRAFLQALEGRGLLRSPDTSQLAQRLGSHLEAIKTSLGDSVTPEACSVVVICVAAVWIWVAVVQDAVVAVAAAAVVSVYAYALVYTSTYGGGGGPKKKGGAAGTMLEGEPSFRLAGALGGTDFQERVTDAFVDDNVEKIAAAVESLDAYRQAEPLRPDQLRTLVRAQMLRHLQGHGVTLVVPGP
jgi:hypothetical protein